MFILIKRQDEGRNNMTYGSLCLTNKSPEQGWKHVIQRQKHNIFFWNE